MTTARLSMISSMYCELATMNFFSRWMTRVVNSFAVWYPKRYTNWTNLYAFLLKMVIATSLRCSLKMSEVKGG